MFRDARWRFAIVLPRVTWQSAFNATVSRNKWRNVGARVRKDQRLIYYRDCDDVNSINFNSHSGRSSRTKYRENISLIKFPIKISHLLSVETFAVVTFSEMGRRYSGLHGNLKYGRVPLLQLKNPMTLCLTRMRVHLERRTVAAGSRGHEANPLSVVLLRCQRLPLSLSLLRFCGRKSSRRPSAMSLVFTRLRVRSSPLLALVRPTSVPVVCRRVLTDFHRSEIARRQRGSGDVAECSRTMRRLR